MKIVTIAVVILIGLIAWAAMAGYIGYNYGVRAKISELVTRPDTISHSIGVTDSLPSIPPNLQPKEVVRYIKETRVDTVVKTVILRRTAKDTIKDTIVQYIDKESNKEKVTQGKIKLDNYFMNWYFVHETSELFLERENVEIDVPKIPKKLFRIGASGGIASSKYTAGLFGLSLNLPRLCEKLHIGFGISTLPEQRGWFTLTYYFM